MRYLKTYKIFESNKDSYLDLKMVLDDLFDDWGIVPYSNENFQDDVDYPEHKFWSFRDISSEMTSSLDSLENVKDLVIYNIPVEHKDRFWDDLLSYREQIEGVTGKKFQAVEESPNNYFEDYILKLL